MTVKTIRRVCLTLKVPTGMMPPEAWDWPGLLDMLSSDVSCLPASGPVEPYSMTLDQAGALERLHTALESDNLVKGEGLDDIAVRCGQNQWNYAGVAADLRDALRVIMGHPIDWVPASATKPVQPVAMRSLHSLSEQELFVAVARSAGYTAGINDGGVWVHDPKTHAAGEYAFFNPYTNPNHLNAIANRYESLWCNEVNTGLLDVVSEHVACTLRQWESKNPPIVGKSRAHAILLAIAQDGFGPVIRADVVAGWHSIAPQKVLTKAGKGVK